MRRLTGWLAVVVLAASGWACKRKPAQADLIDDESLKPLSVLKLGHPRSDTQLLSGFHQLEANSWRWTMSKFSVALDPPSGSAQKGVELQLDFTLPDSVASRRKDVTISAWVAGTPVTPFTYTRQGDYVYRAEVPASALVKPPVKVLFVLDHYLKAGEVDPRELGVVVRSVGLVAK